MTRIPMHSRMGEVVAYVTVDDGDAAWASQWRWVLNSNGYAWRSIMGGKRHRYLHRELLGLDRGDRRQVDHANRDKLDNQRANLRIVTPAQQAQNKPAIGGSSSYRGVSWDSSRRKWTAACQLNGKRHQIGRYDDELDAARAAAAFRREHLPFSEEAAA